MGRPLPHDLACLEPRRVSDRNFKRVHAVLGDAATVELVGILGYYVMISMILDVFRMMPPATEPLPFAEK